jgi:copper chaperone NosL
MKRNILSVLLITFLFSICRVASGQDDLQKASSCCRVASAQDNLQKAPVACAHDDLQKAPACKYCGMDRAQFAHSRMLVEYDDGTTVGVCSLHCLAVDYILNTDKTPRCLKVGDYTGKNLIDAEKAFWLIDGNKPGVMTKQAKWAFEKKADAEKYIAESGGTLATFDEAMTAAFEGMYADTKMIREKRKMMKKQ